MAYYNPNYNYDYTSDVTSKYNEAVMQIQRLHNAWQNCNYYARTGNFQSWRWELDIIWRELIADVKKIDESKVKKMLDMFPEYKATNIEGLNDALKSEITGCSKIQLYDAIDKRHIFLKQLQDIAGKGSVFEEQDADGM